MFWTINIIIGAFLTYVHYKTKYNPRDAQRIYDGKHGEGAWHQLLKDCIANLDKNAKNKEQ